jgi:uncharacterized cupin superfamily protein
MAEGIVEGDGYAVGSLDAMGEGYGFRKVRQELGVTAFGVNAIVMPPGFTAGAHYHDEQEELYVCLDGLLSLEFEDGSKHVLEPGGMARVDAATVRRMGNPGEADCTYICIGGKDGYVGRDGQLPEGESRLGD